MNFNFAKAACLVRGLVIGALIIIALNSTGRVITVNVFPLMQPIDGGFHE